MHDKLATPSVHAGSEHDARFYKPSQIIKGKTTASLKYTRSESTTASPNPTSTDRNEKAPPVSLHRLFTSASSLKKLARRRAKSDASTSTADVSDSSSLVSLPYSHYGPPSPTYIPTTPPMWTVEAARFFGADIPSPHLSPVSLESATTASIKSPETPQNNFSKWTKPEASKAEYPTSVGANFLVITRIELAEKWLDALNLANMNRHQESREAFQYLISQPGVPDYFQPLLAFNCGILMLREHANFPALHMFYVISQEMCHAGPLKTLSFFLMGVATWNLAFANTDPNEWDGLDSDTADKTPANYETVNKARLFFKTALDVLGENEATSFHCAGLDFVLDRSKLLDNIRTCDHTMALLCISGSRTCLWHMSIHKLPWHALFMPSELRGIFRNFNTGLGFSTRPHSGLGALDNQSVKRIMSEVSQRYWQSLEERLSFSALTTDTAGTKGSALNKPLPLIPGSAGIAPALRFIRLK